jgi:hypothetical protein
MAVDHSTAPDLILRAPVAPAANNRTPGSLSRRRR